MFFHSDIKGDRLPPRTLCLTYDDGPGPDTATLARYLGERGIPATFFVLGRHAEQQPETLRIMAQYGHAVGNHTYSHPGLVHLLARGGDVVDELLKTDALIRANVAQKTIWFRPPYGNWRGKSRPDGPEDEPMSPVATVLNQCPALADTVGPVKWELHAEDWECWRTHVPAEKCARRYYERIASLRRGIVLMHDSSDDDQWVGRNRTLELTQRLIPRLVKEGYRFVPLDALPYLEVDDGSAALSALQPLTPLMRSKRIW